MAAAEPAARDEWIALARSIAMAEETWYGLFLGSRADKLIVSAGLGARHNKLAPRLQAVEADPIAFSRLHAAIEAQAFTADEVRLLQAEISATPAESPPRAATMQDLLAEAPRCDLLHIGARGLVVPLVNHALDLLESRVRWLVIQNWTRAEEHRAVVHLSPRGWQLLADHPCTLDLMSPRRALRPGTQVWRGPLA